MTAPQYDATIPAVAHGGRFDPDPPAFDVVHSTEGPMSPGNARALAVNWFGLPKSEGGAGTSTTGIVDPVESVRMLDEHTIPYHVGPYGNPLSTGDEHCGSVNLTPEQWMSERGQAMLDRAAKIKAQRAIARDWSLADCRWLSLTEVAQRTVRGFCTHNDIRLALGGTTHTDPGRNFPYKWYMDRIRYWFQVLTGAISEGDAVTPDDVDAIAKKTADRVWAYGLRGELSAPESAGALLVRARLGWALVRDLLPGVSTRAVSLVAATAELLGRPAADVDEAALAAELAPLLPSTVGTLSDDTLSAIARAVADEQGHRLGRAEPAPVDPAPAESGA